MKTLFLAFILIITLNGCSKDNSSDTFVPVNITPVLIGKGFTYDTVTPNNLVINNQSDWAAFLLSMNLVSSTFINTNVDFNIYEVISVVDLPRGSTAYSINIDTVIENLDNITVNYSLLNSGDGFTSMVQPYHIVRIPKIDKPFIFQ